ncbi:MAG: AsmA-like C-terminal region-containing protein [Methylophilaceae bacterium]
MNSNATYTKTSRGLRALIKKLPRNAGLVLSKIDGDLTSEDISSKLTNINREDFDSAITWLLEGGFIKPVAKDPFSDSVWDAAAMHGAVQVDEINLDQFTVSEKPSIAITKTAAKKKETREELSDEDSAKIKALEQADIEARERAEAALKAKLEAETTKEKKKLDEEARERAEIEARAQAEADKTAKEDQARTKSETKAAAEKKEKLETEEKAKLEALAKTEEEARERAEVEALEKAAAKEQVRLEAVAKKEEQAKVKTEKKEEAKLVAEEKALEKAAAKEQARLEAVVKKEGRARIKAEKREEARLAAEGKDRTPNKVNFTPLIKKWIKNVFKSIKPLSIYAIAVLFLLIIAAQFINFHIWINPIERVAEENIQDSVNIKSVRISFFPSPHLLLEGLTIADSTTITAERIRVYPNLLNLKEKLLNASNSPYKVGSISIENFKIAQKDLPRIVSWKDASSRDQQLKINKISLKNMSIHLNNIELPNFNGEILLDNAGQLKEATIATENKNLTAIIRHTNNIHSINIDAISWRAPLLPYPIFTKLRAKGTINENVMTFSSITGELYNGSLDANLNIDLASEKLASKGRFKLNNFFLADMAEELKLNTVVDGKLNAKGRFSFKFSKPLNKIVNAQLTTTFNIKNGHLRTVDLTEAMRRGNLSGHTKFTKLSGYAALTNKTYRFTNLLLRDNQLSARGHLKLSPEHHVSGVIASTIDVKRNPINARLQINGPLTALKLKN